MTEKWTQAYSVGNTHIDNQHEELFQLTFLLDTAIANSDVTKLNDIILFLEDYVVTHFKEEEDIMAAADFSGLNHHHSEHEQFKLKVGELRVIYDEGVQLTHLFFKIRKFLDDLVFHIKTVDSKMAKLYGENHE